MDGNGKETGVMLLIIDVIPAYRLLPISRHNEERQHDK
jgi:hypothetical protein